MVRSSVPVKRIAAVFNSLRNNIRREAGYRIIKRTLFKVPPLDNLGGRVAGKWDRGGELFSITCYYFSVEFKGF